MALGCHGENIYIKKKTQHPFSKASGAQEETMVALIENDIQKQVGAFFRPSISSCFFQKSIAWKIETETTVKFQSSGSIGRWQKQHVKEMGQFCIPPASLHLRAVK